MNETEPTDGILAAAQRRQPPPRPRQTQAASAAELSRNPTEMAASVDEDEFVDPDTGERLTRRSLDADNANPFHVPKELYRAGWDYEYKATHVLGAEIEAYNRTFEFEQGWRPVTETTDPQMFARLKPPGWSEPTIRRGGCILMKRPMHLSREAAEELQNRADEQKMTRMKLAMQGSDDPIKGTRRHVQELQVEGEVGVHHRK